MCLATMTYVYAAGAVCVTIFSAGGKFLPVSNFTESHILTQATVFVRSCMYLHSLTHRP